MWLGFQSPFRFTARLAVWMMTAGHLPALAPALGAVRRAVEQVFETE